MSLSLNGSATRADTVGRKNEIKCVLDVEKWGLRANIQYKWWEEQANDGSVKWTTFHHRGILFPPPYVPLPKGVKMKYGGRQPRRHLATPSDAPGTPLTLPHESEEVAGFFAAMLETDHAQDPTFRENFFKGFTETLAKYPPVRAIVLSIQRM